MTDRFIRSCPSRITEVLAICLLVMLTACAEEDPVQFIQQGKALFEKGDKEGARVQFKNALQANPKLAEAYYGLALLDEKKSDLQAMKKNLQEVVALDPNHVDAQAKLGLLLADQLDKAKAQLAIVNKLDPENINTILLNATLLLREGDKVETLRRVEQALAKDATNADAVRLQTFILASDQHYDEALAALNRGIEAHPGDSGLGLLRVRIHREQKKFDEVVLDYQALIAKHPDDKKLRQEQIQVLTQIGKSEQAEQALREGIAKEPANSDLKLMLVNFIEPRDAAKAETVLKDFLAASPADIKLKTRLAGYYIGHKRTSDAEAQLKEIVAADPTGKEGLIAKVRLAELAWTRSDKTTAETLVEEVVAADGGNSGALLFRASVRLAKQNMDGAISDLRVVLRDQPSSDQAMVMMAQAYAMKGEAEVAEGHWRKALEVNPGNLSALGSLTSALFKRGDAARAEELLTKSLKASPSNPTMLELLVQARALQKNWTGAEAAVAELKKQPQAVLAAQLLEGMLADSQGRHLDAIQSYKNVLAKKPEAAEALVAMARAYEAAGRRGEFFTFLKAFIQQNPSSIVAYNTLGMAYVAEKKWVEAGQTLQEALRHDPKAIATYKLLTGVLMQQGKAADVVALYRQGLEASPDNPELMLGLAKYHDGAKDYPAAIAAYDNLLKKNPGNDEAANNMAYLLVEFGGAPDNLEQAITLAERFKDSPNPYFVDTYGWVLFKSGKAEAAIGIFKKAVAVAPDNAEFRYHLGEACYAIGDKNAAKLELEKSLLLAQKTREFASIGRVKQLLDQLAMTASS